MIHKGKLYIFQQIAVDTTFRGRHFPNVFLEINYPEI